MSSFVWLVLLGMCAAAVAAGLFTIDPLGLGSATKYESQRIFQRLHAAAYGRGTSAQEQITIVLIDDAYVDSTGHSWPIPYRYQAALFRKILSHEPQRLFIDLVYRTPHSATEQPAELFESQRRKDVPIMLTALASKSIQGEGGNCIVDQPFGAPSLIDAASVHDSLYDLGEGQPKFPQLQIAYVGWYGCGEQYPLYLGGNPDVPTPAFALYRSIRGEQSVDATNFKKPMSVVWGSIQSSQSKLIHAGESSCASQPTRQQYFWGQLREAIVRGGGLPRQPCPYTDYVLASQLMASGASATGGPTADQWLAGRTVLVGLAVTGIPDVVASPVHGQIPGVFLHAMALDNLLAYGESYTRAPSPKVAIALQVAIMLSIAIGYSWLRLVRRSRHFRELEPSRKRGMPMGAIAEFALWIALFCVLAVLAYRHDSGLGLGAAACLISCIGFDLSRKRFLLSVLWSFGLALSICLSLWQWFDLEPFNWIALAAMIAAVREAILKAHKRYEEFEDDKPGSVLLDINFPRIRFRSRSRA